MFFEQGIQQYDGKNFKIVNSSQLNDKDLSLVDNMRRSDNGGIHFELDQSAYQIDPGTTTVKYLSQTDSETMSNPYVLDQNKTKFTVNKQNLIAEKGGIWKIEHGNKVKIFGGDEGELKCTLLKKDGLGNHIALFGYKVQITEKILVIRNDGSIEEYSHLLNYNKNIRDIYTDNIDSKWIVGTFNGIFIFHFKEEGIDHFYVRPNLEKSQFGHIITAINTETDKVLFLKETYGLREIDSSNQVNLLFDDRPEYFYRNQRLLYDRFNEVMYSYSFDSHGDFELLRFNPVTKEIGLDYIPLRIRDFHNLNKDHLLIAGHELHKEKNKDSGSMYTYHKINKSLTKVIDKIPAIRAINYIKGTNEFWLGTQYGIYIYDTNFKLKEILNAELDSGEKYISHPEIRTMYEMEDLVIAGSFKGGIYLIDKKTKKITKQLSESNGLSDNAIASIIEDDQKNIWIATFNGINVLNQQFEITQKIYEYNGLPNREFNTDAVAKDKEGNLFLGTLNGVVRINPSKILNRKTSQGLHLSKVEIYNGKQHETFSELSSVVSTYNKYDSLRLKVNFPDYYKYRFDNWSSFLNFENKDNNIVQTSENELKISSLPIGEYEFGFFNSTNNNHQSLALEIKRDYTKIFGILGLVGFALFLTYLFFTYRMNQLRKFEREKTKINTKIAELELTALRSQMNPHFIFNALGSVQYFIQTQETEKADSYLSNFAKLMRKILDSSKSKFISLQEESNLLKLYVGLEKMRFEKMFDFTMKIDPEIDLENPLPPMVIQPFVENAINHGIYHLTNRQGTLLIHFKHVDETKMQCIITDNGIGRVAANKIKRPNHKSRGLEIVQDRIQTINSQSDVKLDITTLDLDDGNQSTGTQVIINIEYEE